MPTRPVWGSLFEGLHPKVHGESLEIAAVKPARFESLLVCVSVCARRLKFNLQDSDDLKTTNGGLLPMV